MRILRVFGSSHGVGLELCKMAVAQGWYVKAHARRANPQLALKGIVQKTLDAAKPGKID